MSIFVWSMIGVALWHFTILVPDRFVGGIIGALLAGWGGAFASGFMLEGFEVPSHNPPGLRHALPGHERDAARLLRLRRDAAGGLGEGRLTWALLAT